MLSKTKRSSFPLFVIVISLLFQVAVVVLSEGVSNSELLGINKDDVPFGLVGGKDVDIKSANYIGALLITIEEPALRGIGTILSNKWVLTTAINVLGYDPSQFQVRVGSSHYDKEGTVHQVCKYIIHPLYNHGRDYNIALLKLEIPITFSNVAHRIKIASSRELRNGSIGKVFGFSWKHGRLNGKLKEVNLQIIHCKSCEQRFKTAGAVSHLNFCTATNHKRPCDKDIGSPFVQKDKLVGIFTESSGCTSSQPCIYADVTRIKTWISGVIKHSRDSDDELINDHDDIINNESDNEKRSEINED